MLRIKGLAEVVLWVHDTEKSVRFYRDLLGFTVISPPSSRAVFLRAGPEVLHCPQQIVLTPLREGTPDFPTERYRRPLHHIGFEISPEDLDGTAQRLKAEGVSFREGEHPFLPFRGLYIDDPDGNEIELLIARR